ncbi:MAG: DUF58 domain-containing protein, partial [Faecousia sp.]
MRRLIWACLTALALLGCLLRPSAALGICFGCCLLLPLLSWGLAWLAREKLTLQMESASAAEKGKQFPLTLRCSRGRLPSGGVSVLLIAENAVTGQYVKKKLLLREAQTVELESAFCGCLRCSVQKARLWDFCGLLPVPLSCGAVKRVSVMPHTFPVEVCMESAPALNEDCQEYAQDRKGQDRTETYQLRDYAAGDSLSQIHWKLSSKRGH